MILVILPSLGHWCDFGDVVKRLFKHPSHEDIVEDMDMDEEA